MFVLHQYCYHLVSCFVSWALVQSFPSLPTRALYHTHVVCQTAKCFALGECCGKWQGLHLELCIFWEPSHFVSLGTPHPTCYACPSFNKRFTAKPCVYCLFRRFSFQHVREREREKEGKKVSHWRQDLYVPRKKKCEMESSHLQELCLSTLWGVYGTLYSAKQQEQSHAGARKKSKVLWKKTWQATEASEKEELLPC